MVPISTLNGRFGIRKSLNCLQNKILRIPGLITLNTDLLRHSTVLVICFGNSIPMAWQMLLDIGQNTIFLEVLSSLIEEKVKRRRVK